MECCFRQNELDYICLQDFKTLLPSLKNISEKSYQIKQVTSY